MGEPVSRRIGEGEIHHRVRRGRRGERARQGAKARSASFVNGKPRGETVGRPVAPRPVAANPDSHREQAGRRVPAAAGGTVSDARRRVFSKRRVRPLGDRPAGVEGTQSLRIPFRLRMRSVATPVGTFTASGNDQGRYRSMNSRGFMI